MRQLWDLEPTESGVRVTITLDVHEEMEVQEYHASVLLQTGYQEWLTTHESGLFPEITHDLNDWHHLNKTYEPGKDMCATGRDLPELILSAGCKNSPVTMTVLNTGYDQASRVLQALRLPRHGRIRFSKGLHHYLTIDIRTR